MKTGGSVAKAVEYAKRDRKEVDTADIAQDKKIVKKAIGMHDAQQHEAKTDLTGLKKGGRAKKKTGTVKKYCGGKSVKKMADGGEVDVDTTAAQKPAPQGSGYDSDPFVKLRKKVFGS